MLMKVLINNVKLICIIYLLISPIITFGQYVDDLYYNDNEIDYSYLYDSSNHYYDDYVYLIIIMI